MYMQSHRQLTRVEPLLVPDTTNIRHVPGIAEEIRNHKKEDVKVLINSVQYFLDWAIIVAQKGGYRLVVSQCGKIMTDRHYVSLKGAKIGFVKIYQYLAFCADHKPHWTATYRPVKTWLVDRLNKGAITYN